MVFALSAADGTHTILDSEQLINYVKRVFIQSMIIYMGHGRCARHSNRSLIIRLRYDCDT